MILAVCVALAACNSVAATPVRTRWEAETHVFDITLADYIGAETNSFKTYDANGAVAANGAYHKDMALSGEMNDRDEIRPLAVKGKYTVSIQPSGDGSAYCDVKTTQKMCVFYNATDISEALSGAVATPDQLTELEVDNTLGSLVTILWSSTETTVRFENTTSQKPLSSSVKAHGFYVGKVTQQLSRYELTTEYDYSTNTPVAKITLNGEAKEYKFSKNSAGSFIDSNQILIYLRSLDKSSTSFNDSPSKSVFNPYSQSLQTARFGLSYSNNLMLTDYANGKTLLTNKLNVVSVMVGNNAFMLQENLPDTLTLNDKKLDAYSTLSGMESKFTTVRFRVGYLAYEISYGDNANSENWGDIWTALTPAPSAEEK